MTTAYAQHAPQERAFHSPAHLHLVPPYTAPAQGPEAVQVRKVVNAAVARGTAERGQSLESAKILAAVQQLQLEMAQHIETLRASMQVGDDSSYNHIPVKQVFSVQATYKHIGTLKPRQFPLDE